MTFYIRELISYKVEDNKLGHLGKILEIMEHKDQINLILGTPNEEIIIPFVEPLIQGIDQENGVVYTDLPEGLIELNRK